MKAQMRPVTERFAVGARSIISSGLQSGDKIITAGIVKVRPGAVVQAAALADNASPPAQAEQARP